MSTESEQLQSEFDLLVGQRGTFEVHWSRAARIASPRDDHFNQETITQGQQVRRHQYDEHAERVLERATALFGSVTTPENQKWHRLQQTNIFLEKIQAVREYFDTVNEILFKWRYAPRAGFAVGKHEQNRSLLGFGTGALFIGAGVGDPKFRSPLWYKAIHLAEIFISENQQGFVDKVYRRTRMSGRQIIDEYGEENVPSGSLDQLKKDSETFFVVIHAVRPNPKFEPDSLNPDKFKYMSRHWLQDRDDDTFLREGGFRTFPYAITRDTRRPTEQYGRGTLLRVLPAIQMRNQMKRTQIRVWHQASDPTLLLRDDGSIDVADVRAGRAIVGGLDSAGNPTIQPFQSGANFEVSMEFLIQEAETINEAFMLDLFLNSAALEGRDRVTATEILARDQERVRIMTPISSRDETESLGPMIERELDILTEFDLLPPMPPELIEAEGEFDIEFTNPLAVSRRSDEAIGSVQTVQAMMELAALDPSAMDNINSDEYSRILARANSSPEALLNSSEEVAAIRQQRAEQEALEMAAQAAPGVGRGILDMTKAEDLVNNAGIEG